MANNRLYLKFNPTGKTFFLAKRMFDGWYLPATFTEDKFNEFLNECWKHLDEGHPDDFSLELETPVSENTPLKI